jgi:hypothetical protein
MIAEVDVSSSFASVATFSAFFVLVNAIFLASGYQLFTGSSIYVAPG